MRIFLLAITLFFPLSLNAAPGDNDGTPCTAGVTWAGGKCTILCDEITADRTCGPILLGTQMNTIAIELQQNGGSSGGRCDSGDVFIFSQSKPDQATKDPWHVLPGNLDLEATNSVGTSLISIDGAAAAPMRYMKAVVTGEAQCDSVTVVVHQK